MSNPVVHSIAETLIKKADMEGFRICQWHIEEELEALYEGGPVPQEMVINVARFIHARRRFLLSRQMTIEIGYVPDPVVCIAA